MRIVLATDTVRNVEETKKMRPREEIEKSGYNAYTVYAIQIELLLDIRELIKTTNLALKDLNEK